MYADGTKAEVITKVSKTELLRALFDMTIHNRSFCYADARSWSLAEAEDLERVAGLIRRSIQELEP